MKKLILLCACLLALSVKPAAAQASEPDMVVVRVDEPMGRLIIARGEGKSQVIEFPASTTEKKAVAAAELYHRIMKQLYQEGYVLHGSMQSGDVHSTMLFVKAPKP